MSFGSDFLDNRYIGKVLEEMTPFFEEQGFKEVKIGEYKNESCAVKVDYDEARQMYVLSVAGEEGDYAEISSWLFDDSQSERDAGSVGIDFTETLREKFYSSAPFGAKQRPFIDNVIAGSKELVEWLEGLGLPFEPGYCVGGEAVYAVCPEGSAVNKMNLESMTYLTKFLSSKIEEKGGQFLLSTEAEALVMADGAVKGVQCTAEDGSTIYV